MLDPKFLLSNPELVTKALLKRGFSLDIGTLKGLYNQWKSIQVKTESLQQERNDHSKNIGKAKIAGEDIAPLLKEMIHLKTQLVKAEEERKKLQEKLDTLLEILPNIPTHDVPEGKNEYGNLEIRRWGTPRRFDFTIKDHVDLGINLGKHYSDLDLDVANKLTGPRFAVMRGGVARLHRSLIQFMIDTHIEEHNYQEIYVPFLVNKTSLFSTGQLPKFEKDLFKINGKNDLYLIPTAEVPMTNLLRNELLTNDQLLPLKLVCHSPCFRSEAGSYGRDTRGMIRQHQFEKVELVNFVKPTDSEQALEDLTICAEAILQKLKLPYRTVILCAGDIGFSAAKTYDIEVWLPSQNQYREVSSCSNFNDFQTRRMKTRYKDSSTGKTELLHTLNGSALAIGRTLLAIMENYQQADGSIKIPPVLQSYMGARKIR